MKPNIEPGLTEQDIRSRFINPALDRAGWTPDKRQEEYYFTDGTIVVNGTLKSRKKGNKADYLLCLRENYPIAIVEAKDYDHHTPSDGIQQAMDYAKTLDIPFAYSSNGEQFFEHDMLEGTEKYIDMDKFPTIEELTERYKKESKLTDEEESIIDVPYYSDSKSYEPRYYQRIAINRAIEAVARGKKRILLVMATGTGKTYTAFQICHRLHKAKKANRILYIADRNILIDQTMRDDFAPFRKVMKKIQKKTPEPGYEIYMSLYGQWVLNEKERAQNPGAKQPYENFSRDFFDFIVVDECHRSSPNENSEWHEILEYFSPSIQLGLTATPREDDGANNIKYFGKPIYVYSLAQGIRDGFLAPYHVTRSYLNVDVEGYIAERNEKSIEGYDLKPYYARKDFGRKINILRRQEVVAKRITEMLKFIGRITKTIVFCPRTDEADQMRQLLIKENQDIVKKHPDYIVRITGDDRVGKKLLDKFANPDSPFPVVATTSELLSTGVNCQTLGLIVFDKEVGSMSTFKQMLGRGTRIYDKDGFNKLSFEILDFRNVTIKFSDPGFDGPENASEWPPRIGPTTDTTEQPTDSIEQPTDTTEQPTDTTGQPTDTPEQPTDTTDQPTDTPEQPTDTTDQPTDTTEQPTDPPQKEPFVHIKGKYTTKIVNERVLAIGADGKTIETESVTDYTREIFKKRFASLNQFQIDWINSKSKKDVLAKIEGGEKFAKELLEAVRKENPELADADIFDIICDVAFNKKPLTRKERAANVNKRDIFNKYSKKAQEVLNALIEQYQKNGILDIEDKNTLNNEPFRSIGNLTRIMTLFGDKQGKGYDMALKEIEDELYKEA